MIYLATFLVLWVWRALLPAIAAGAAGALIAFFFRRRAPGMVAISALVAAFAVGGWRTWSLWRNFTHPEFSMFREYIANPIPPEVRNLEPADPSPVMFHPGAIIRFDAPESVLRGIVAHTLPGSTAQAVLAELRARNANGRGRSVRGAKPNMVIADADGRSYMRVDSLTFPPAIDSIFQGLRYRISNAARVGREVYAFAESGIWGSFQSVMSYDRRTGKIEIFQSRVLTPLLAKQ